MSLAQYDRKRMAVVMPIRGERKVLRGSALYLRDEKLGNCLRIDSQEEPRMELFLKEDQWVGKIVKDETYGCDFCVCLDHDRRAN